MSNDIDDDGGEHEGHGEGDNAQLSGRRQEDVVRLLSFLLDRFAAERDVPAAHRHAIEPRRLFGWLRDNNDELLSEGLREQSGVDDAEVHETLQGLLHSPLGPLLLEQIWPAVLLFGRPLPAVPVRQVVVDLVLHFEDDTTVLVNSSVPALAVSSPISDALVCTILSEVTGSLQKILYATPLDELRRTKAVDNAGVAGYQVFMGAALKALQTLPEPQRRASLAWFRIMQQLAMPMLPPALLQALQQRREAFQRAQESAESGGGAPGDSPQPPQAPPQSGWDDD